MIALWTFFRKVRLPKGNLSNGLQSLKTSGFYGDLCDKQPWNPIGGYYMTISYINWTCVSLMMERQWLFCTWQSLGTMCDSNWKLWWHIPHPNISPVLINLPAPLEANIEGKRESVIRAWDQWNSWNSTNLSDPFFVQKTYRHAFTTILN